MWALVCECFQWNYQLPRKALRADGILAERPLKLWGIFVGVFFPPDSSQLFGLREGDSPGK